MRWNLLVATYIDMVARHYHDLLDIVFVSSQPSIVCVGVS